MENKRAEVSLVLVGLTALSLLAIATIPAGAQIDYANVSIGNITLSPQETATLPIMIDVATADVMSAQIDLAYDPTVVQVTAVVGNPQWDYFDYNPLNGEVRMIGNQWWSQPLTAPVNFANVTVKAVGNPGDYTPLNLECYDVNGVATIQMGTGSPYPEVNTNNGSVTIIGAVPAYNIFGMFALIGLLAIVLAVTVRRR